MNKRGQVYILAAIIIAFVVYNLFVDTNIVRETIIDDDFEELATNYEVESSKLVNYLLENKIDQASTVSKHFTNFTASFTAYSKTKNPNFGLLYLFDYGGNLYIGNYLDEDADVAGSLVKGCLKMIPAGFRMVGQSLYIGIGVFETTGVSPCIAQISSGGEYNYDVDVKVKNSDGTEETYKAFITKGKPDIVIISREIKDNVRKVYTKGKFVHSITELDLD